MEEDINYALISEGSSDVASIEILCGRIGEEIGCKMVMVPKFSSPVNGPISENAIKVRFAQMGNSSEDIDLVICVADSDKIGNLTRLRRLRSTIDEVGNGRWAPVSVVGSPDRNLEAWLLADEDCVKHELGLDGSRPLPRSGEDDPKNRLMHLVSDSEDESLTPSEFRRIMANKLDLNVLSRRSDSFKKFSEELKRTLRNLT